MYFLASEDGQSRRSRRRVERSAGQTVTPRINLLAPLPPQTKRYIDDYYDDYELNQICSCDHSVTSKTIPIVAWRRSGNWQICAGH
jgi:hypothetical protein